MGRSGSPIPTFGTLLMPNQGSLVEPELDHRSVYRLRRAGPPRPDGFRGVRPTSSAAWPISTSPKRHRVHRRRPCQTLHGDMSAIRRSIPPRDPERGRRHHPFRDHRLRCRGRMARWFEPAVQPATPITAIRRWLPAHGDRCPGLASGRCMQRHRLSRARSPGRAPRTRSSLSMWGSCRTGDSSATPITAIPTASRSIANWVWTSAGDGAYLGDRRRLGSSIAVVSNCCFDADGRRLFITAIDHLAIDLG